AAWISQSGRVIVPGTTRPRVTKQLGTVASVLGESMVALGVGDSQSQAGLATIAIAPTTAPAIPTVRSVGSLTTTLQTTAPRRSDAWVLQSWPPPSKRPPSKPPPSSPKSPPPSPKSELSASASCPASPSP